MPDFYIPLTDVRLGQFSTEKVATLEDINGHKYHVLTDESNLRKDSEGISYMRIIDLTYSKNETRVVLCTPTFSGCQLFWLSKDKVHCVEETS